MLHNYVKFENHESDFPRKVSLQFIKKDNFAYLISKMLFYGIFFKELLLDSKHVKE